MMIAIPIFPYLLFIVLNAVSADVKGLSPLFH